MAFAKRRRWADAEAALVKVVTAVPADGQAWHQLGLARYELRDLQGAEAALLQAIKKTDSSVSSKFMLAVIAASQGRIDTAFERLDRAVEGREDLSLDQGGAADSSIRSAVGENPREEKILEKTRRRP